MLAALDIDGDQVMSEMGQIRIVRRVRKGGTRPSTMRIDASTDRSNVGQMT